MARSKQSKRWLKEHFEDRYVLAAQKQGYRSRAAFKLLEIQAKDQLIKPNMIVVDLGAAPGGWSQVVTQLVKPNGRVFALDILAMPGLADVTFLQGDFKEEAVVEQLQQQLAGAAVDLVLSDMAPNMSGMTEVDQPRAMYLAECALDFAMQVLKPGGALLVKVFQGTDFQAYLKTAREAFATVVTRKPKASRARSRELYILAKGKRERGTP